MNPISPASNATAYVLLGLTLLSVYVFAAEDAADAGELESATWWSEPWQTIRQQQYEVTCCNESLDGAPLYGANWAQDLRAFLRDSSAEATHCADVTDRNLRFQLRGFGRENFLLPVGCVESSGEGRRVEYAPPRITKAHDNEDDSHDGQLKLLDKDAGHHIERSTEFLSASWRDAGVTHAGPVADSLALPLANAEPQLVVDIPACVFLVDCYSEGEGHAAASFWILETGILDFGNGSNTYFVESGGAILQTGGSCVSYLKSGGSFNCGGSGSHVIYYEPGAIIEYAGGSAELIPCSSIDFIPPSYQNQAPVPALTYSPENPYVGEVVWFNASSSYDPDDCTMYYYEWNFGDGNNAHRSVPWVSHTFTEAGTYTITLTVADNLKLTATKDTTLTVGGTIMEIVEARMVTPDELGIGINVTYPASCEEQTPRKVVFNALINGTHVESPIDISQYTTPGESWGCQPGVENEMFDVNGNLKPTTPLRINLASKGVSRFAKNESFDLSARASCGEQSSPLSEKLVDIPLPVVILHGYIHPWGYPLPWWLGGNLISYEVAYKSLTNFLVKNGYDNENQWELYGIDKYRTLWDPRDFSYSNPWLSTPAVIKADLDQLMEEISAHSYACKANLIGHSFGGLVARYYASFGDVSKVVTVGTPHQGATFFYEALFNEFSNKKKVEDRLTINEGPYAGQKCIIQWTAPTYPCLFDERGSGILPPFPNTFAAQSSANTEYFSIFAQDSPTNEKLVLQRKGGWYKIIDEKKGMGDGYILGKSARAFGQPLPTRGSMHAFLCSNKQSQDWILAALRDVSFGRASCDGREAIWYRDTIATSETKLHGVSIDPGMSRAVFDLTWQGSDLDLVVCDPSGDEITSETASAYPGADFVEGDSYEECIIANPSAGDWVMKIRAIDVGEAGEGYMAMFHLLPSEPSRVSAVIDVDPDTLNLASLGNDVTCYIELPSGYDPGDIVIGTVKMQDSVVAKGNPSAVGDYDCDGVPDLMVKFDRQELIASVEPGEQILGVTGQFTQEGEPMSFEGSDTVTVVTSDGAQPNSGKSRIPFAFVLSQTQPNPSRGGTSVSYTLAMPARVTLAVYDIGGRRIRTLVNGWRHSGLYTETWDGRADDGGALPSGVYFYRLEAGDFVATRKMVLLH